MVPAGHHPLHTFRCLAPKCDFDSEFLQSTAQPQLLSRSSEWVNPCPYCILLLSRDVCPQGSPPFVPPSLAQDPVVSSPLEVPGLLASYALCLSPALFSAPISFWPLVLVPPSSGGIPNDCNVMPVKGLVSCSPFNSGGQLRCYNILLQYGGVLIDLHPQSLGSGLSLLPGG